MHQGVVDLVPAALQHSIGFVRSGSAPPVANSVGRVSAFPVLAKGQDSSVMLASGGTEQLHHRAHRGPEVVAELGLR